MPSEEKTTASAEDVVVIDVRSPREYAGGHLRGALNVDLQAADFRERIGRLDRTRSYHLYCRSGSRSSVAAQIMREMGFAEVHNAGGLDRLVRDGALLDTGSHPAGRNDRN